MAKIEHRPDRPRKPWIVHYRTPDGKQRSPGFRIKADAEDYLIKVESEKRTGSYVDPRRARVTVGTWADDWLASQNHLKPSTYSRYRGIVEKHVKTRWGKVKLADVRHADIQQWISDIPGAAGSVRKIYLVFSQMLDLAVRDERLAKNPAVGVRLPRQVASEKRFLSRQQLHQLADVAGGQDRVIVLVLGYCGLRWGELAGLTVGRVDTMRARLTVARTISEVDGRLIEGTPKNHQVRTVPIPRFLADLLAEVVAGRTQGELVFPGRTGGALRRRNWWRDTFVPATTTVALDGLTIHELRHTAASLAVGAGANVKAVQRMLGHQSAAMTLDVYAGLFDDDLDAVAARLDAGVDSLLTEATVTELKVIGEGG